MKLASLSSSPASRLAARRALQAVPVLWGATFVTFGLLNLLPGTAALALLGDSATRQQIAALTVHLHLDEPFFVRYWGWLYGVLHGNLGTSISSGVSVSSIIGQKLPVTAELVLLALILSIGFAVPIALIAARHPRGFADRATLLMSMFGLAVPNFVFALLLILILAVHARVLPALGFTPLTVNLWHNLKSLILPAGSLAFGLSCQYARILRADIIDQVESQDYITVAKAKGLSPHRVLIAHAFRNSLFGLLTLVGLNLGTLFGGTVIIEQIFAIPGMGQELLLGISTRDIPIVEGIVVTVSVAVVCANLATDVLYAVLDPRVRHGRPTR